MKNQKKEMHFIMSILKVDITIVPLLFLFFYSFEPRIEICLKNFLDKNSPKKSMCMPCALWAPADSTTAATALVPTACACGL